MIVEGYHLWAGKKGFTTETRRPRGGVVSMERERSSTRFPSFRALRSNAKKTETVLLKGEIGGRDDVDRKSPDGTDYRSRD